jgi:hypothetical protein
MKFMNFCDRNSGMNVISKLSLKNLKASITLHLTGLSPLQSFVALIA